MGDSMGILIFATILTHLHALFIQHHSLHIHSVSSTYLEDEKLSKAFVYVILGGPGGAVCFDASP